MGRRKKIARAKGRRVNGTLFQLRDDPRETPFYSVREAAAYVGVARSTLRHWLTVPPKGRAAIAVDPESKLLSFYNLMEAHILRTTMERRIPLGRVRKAIDTLRDRYPNSAHPLLDREFYTAKNRRSLFVKELTGEVNNLSFGGQLEFRKFLEKYLDRIDRDHEGNPYRLHPVKTRHIVIDHRVASGRPVVEGTGVLAEMLAARHRGGEDAVTLAHDYDIPLSDVKEAIKYAA